MSRPAKALLLATVFAVAGCAMDAEPLPPAVTPSARASIVTQPTTTTVLEPLPVAAQDQTGCAGLGNRTGPDDLTWIKERELRSAQGCLLRFDSEVIGPSWNAAGDKLMVDAFRNMALIGGGSVQHLGPGRWRWLGASDDLVRAGDEGVTVRRPDGTEEVVFGVEVRHFAASPDGTWIAGETTASGGTGLYRIDLRSGEATLLKSTELHGVGQVDITPGGDVIFDENEGDRGFLRRWDAGTGRLTTFAESTKFLSPFAVVSRFNEDALAWYAGGSCGGPPTAHATLRGRTLALHKTPLSAVTPTAWLADDSLLFLDRGESCDYSAGTLWSYRDGVVKKIEDDVLDIAIR